MEKRTVSLGATKEAALYFEEVLPVDCLVAAMGFNGALPDGTYENCIPYEDMDQSIAILRSLIPTSRDASHLILDLLTLQAMLLFLDSIKLFDGAEEFERRTSVPRRYVKERFGLTIDYGKALTKQVKYKDMVGRALRRVVTEAGFGGAPTWADSPDGKCAPETSDEHRFAASLAGLNLVDTDKLTWAQIVEFRRDKDAFKSLRDLRLFFEENFTGKDIAYISDKLSQLADDQEKAAALWGFETTRKSLSVAFTHQSAIVTSMTGLAAAVGGAPLSVATSAALIFPLGSVALEFSKALIDAQKDRIKRPTRFLTKLRRLSER